MYTPNQWADPGDVDKKMSVIQFVDLSGKRISGPLKYDKNVDTIPLNLVEAVEDGVCDDEDYEGNYGIVSLCFSLL